MIKKIHLDPHAKREADKYLNPIPSREYILELLRKKARPQTLEQIQRILSLTTDEMHEALRRRLKAMERDGQLIRNRRGAYGLIDKMDLVRGRVVGHKDAYGFIIPDDGIGDLFLNARQMRLVFDGDRVLARVTAVDKRGKKEGTIVEVLERNTQQVIGRYFKENNIAFVVPDNKRITQDIVIPPGSEGLAKHGQIVLASITAQPTMQSRAIGRIERIVGEHKAPGMEIEIATYSHGLPYAWPESVLQEVAGYTETIPEIALIDRVDLRALPLVTIDGEDAKDFDDAVYCQPQPQGGWCLYVAIADVSYYVERNSALDSEARNRGNSVYFPGKVIPMLPEILSNGLCSLKPNVDRLCMVCEMTITDEGIIKHYRFYQAAMRSQARFTYTEVAAYLNSGKTKPGLIYLNNLQQLYYALHQHREKRGAIDFDTVETRVIFGPEHKIEQIVPINRNIAHKIIEECMLAANVAAARFVAKHKIPSLYRIHGGPNPEKLVELRIFLSELGLNLRGSKRPTPSDYALVLKNIQGRPDQNLIQTVLLRSLTQAVYAPENKGHFGLAYDAYAHFTSPIRRYPDLLLHRAIRHLLLKGTADNFPYDFIAMTQLGEHCSMTERRADEATRDALDWLKCEFMQDKVGCSYKGIVTGVTGFGIFVQLQQVYVEGLVHISALKNDYYHYDAARHRLMGERSKRCYRLGDSINVSIAKVDLDEKRIDFNLTD